jgi:hypothetical protein
MFKRWIAGFATFLFCTTAAGCEITASAFVQQEWNTDPRVFSKPDGLAKAEVKITRLIGKDAKK